MSADLLVAAARWRTVLLSGFLAGVCVFFAPLLVLAVGLLAAYLGYIASDASGPTFGLQPPADASDFRAVFAPVVNSPLLLLASGVSGLALAVLRRYLARRTDAAFLAAGIHPYLPEFAASYVLLGGLLVGLGYVAGGWPQVHRLAAAAPVFLLFLLCATWLAHAVWQYAFRSLIDLLASGPEREAAAALRAQRPALYRARPAR